MSQEEDIGWLKAKADATDKKVCELKDNHKLMDEKLDKLLESQLEHKALHERYKGWVGGVVFIWSCVAAMFTTWYQYFRH